MNFVLIILAMIALMFARLMTPNIRVTETITPHKNVIKLHYDTALEKVMIEEWVIPIVFDINQAIKGGGPLFDEYLDEEYETIEIEDNQDVYND